MNRDQYYEDFFKHFFHLGIWLYRVNSGHLSMEAMDHLNIYFECSLRVEYLFNEFDFGL